MKKKIKSFGKDAFTLGVTGIGLSAAAGLDSTGATGAFTGKLGTVGKIAVAGHVMGMVGDLDPYKKKKKR